MPDRFPPRRFRLLILLEGTTVTGPARNVFEFCRVFPAIAEQPAVSPFLGAFLRPAHDQPSQNELFAAAKTAGLTVVPIHERFPFDPRIVSSLRQTVARLQPEIIETHHVKSHFLVHLSGVWRHCPWIAFHHGYTRDSRRTAVYNQLDRWSLPAAARVVTVCQPFQQQLMARGVPASQISVVHNAISADWVEGSGVAGPDCAHIMRAQGTTRTVLAVGRLSQEKAFADLIIALNELRRLSTELPVRLLVAGVGPEMGKLQHLIQELNLRQQVCLLGHISDLRPYYRMADVVAISSISEGCPNVLLEAMAAGVPVAATRVGGIPEIVQDRQTALLVEPKQPGQMAVALHSLLSDGRLAESLATRAQETIRICHSPEARARQLLGLYLSLLA